MKIRSECLESLYRRTGRLGDGSHLVSQPFVGSLSQPNHDASGHVHALTNRISFAIIAERR
jgi:hypothetical protein